MKSILAALLASAAFSANAGLEAVRQVDLDTPGALERVQRTIPPTTAPLPKSCAKRRTAGHRPCPAGCVRHSTPGWLRSC
jgi:hypothetical protein